MSEACSSQVQVKCKEKFFSGSGHWSIAGFGLQHSHLTHFQLHHPASPCITSHEETPVTSRVFWEACLMQWVPDHQDHNWHPPPSTGGLLRCWHKSSNAKREQHCTSPPSCACAPAGCLKALAKRSCFRSDRPPSIILCSIM